MSQYLPGRSSISNLTDHLWNVIKSVNANPLNNLEHYFLYVIRFNGQCRYYFKSCDNIWRGVLVVSWNEIFSQETWFQIKHFQGKCLNTYFLVKLFVETMFLGKSIFRKDVFTLKKYWDVFRKDVFRYQYFQIKIFSEHALTDKRQFLKISK